MKMDLFLPINYKRIVASTKGVLRTDPEGHVIPRVIPDEQALEGGCNKTVFFRVVSPVCPEPVLVKSSFLYIHGSKRPCCYRRVSCPPMGSRPYLRKLLCANFPMFVPSLSWQIFGGCSCIKWRTKKTLLHRSDPGQQTAPQPMSTCRVSSRMLRTSTFHVPTNVCPESLSW
jgi:hypothetical protein